MNRAERRANNKRVIRNRLKELKDLGDTRYKSLAYKSNKLSKQDAFDCGNPKCSCKTEKNFSTLDKKGNKRRDNKFDLKDLDIDET
jgi:hypothetical protein